MIYQIFQSLFDFSPYLGFAILWLVICFSAGALLAVAERVSWWLWGLD